MRPKLIFIFIFILIIMLAACGRQQDFKMLEDFGGIYMGSYDRSNFKEEITGKFQDLSEQSTIEVKKTNEISTSDISKTLRWGIRRKPDNHTPQVDSGAPELLKRYGAVYIGDTNKKEIYLTFDEGYENGYTAQILDTLKENNAKAIFFVTGPYLKEQQNLIKRMIDEGHEIGNHTIHHNSLPTLDNKKIEEEVLGLDRTFSEYFGKSMRFLRPPKGEYSHEMLETTQKLGYTNLFWSFAYDDWYRDKIRGEEYAVKIVENNLHNGAVILLHAVSKDNADALDMIIKNAKAKGYVIGDPLNLIKK